MTTIKHHTSHSHHVTIHHLSRQESHFTHKPSRLGTESRVVTVNTLRMIIIVINIFPLRIVLAYKHFFHLHKCLRPYHREYTGSRLITEVKPGRAGLVLGWVTAWEYPVS